MRAPDQAKELGNVANRCQTIFPACGLLGLASTAERGRHYLGMTQLSALRTMLPLLSGGACIRDRLVDIHIEAVLYPAIVAADHVRGVGNPV